ncbi:unnamed protein product, partial [Brassica rapa]
NSVRTKLYRTGRESVRPVYPLLRAKPATTATDHSPRRSFQ